MTTRLLTHLPGSRSPEPLFEYVPGLRDSAQSFSRSSAARHTSRQEENLEVPSDVLRDFHWVKDENGDLVRATRLEAARTNSILHSEDFSDAAWSKTGSGPVSVTVDNAVAPDGTQTADRLDPSGSSDRIQQSVTVSADSLPRVGSVFLRKGESPQARVELIYRGGTSKDGWIEVDTNDGSIGSVANTVRHGVEDYNPDWWRVWVVISNNGTAGSTTCYLQVFPDFGDGNDTQHVWGAQLEGVSGGADFPSSYIATQGSAVSRAADDFVHPVTFGPREVTIYGKVRNGGAGTGGTWPGLIFHIGDNGSNATHLSLWGHGARLRYDASGGQVDSAFGSDPSIGDIVEYRAVLYADGSVELFRSLNGGAENSGGRSSAVGLDDSWAQNQFRLTPPGTSGQVRAAHISGPLILTGEQSLATCRSLAART